MDLAAHYRAMADNNAWSNMRLHDACVRLSEVEFTARRAAFFPSLQRTLNHILLVDRNYLADLEGTGRSRSGDEIPYPGAVALAAAQKHSDIRLIAFCDVLDDMALTRVVAIDRGDAVPCHESVAAILSHLFVHQIHHRGQAHAMLAESSVPPPQLDQFFLASDEPLRREELLRLERAGSTDPAS